MYIFWDIILIMTGDFILFVFSLGYHKFNKIPFRRKVKVFKDDYFSNASLATGLVFWIIIAILVF